MLGLAYWDNGFKVMSANKPLKEVKDFRGQKMRIQSSKVLDAQMRALGASPQVMAFSEVYQALQTGVVDGTENPPSNLYTQKMHEVQKYVTLSDHGYLGYAVIVNKAFWEGLPADIRTALEEAMAEATVYANEIAKQENEDALAKVKASGKSELIDPHPRAEGGVEEGAGAGPPPDGGPGRQGPDPVHLQGDRQRHRASSESAGLEGRGPGPPGSAGSTLGPGRLHRADSQPWPSEDTMLQRSWTTWRSGSSPSSSGPPPC